MAQLPHMDPIEYGPIDSAATVRDVLTESLSGSEHAAWRNSALDAGGCVAVAATGPSGTRQAASLQFPADSTIIARIQEIEDTSPIFDETVPVGWSLVIQAYQYGDDPPWYVCPVDVTHFARATTGYCPEDGNALIDVTTAEPEGGAPAEPPTLHMAPRFDEQATDAGIVIQPEAPPVPTGRYIVTGLAIGATTLAALALVVLTAVATLAVVTVAASVGAALTYAPILLQLMAMGAL